MYLAMIKGVSIKFLQIVMFVIKIPRGKNIKTLFTGIDNHRKGYRKCVSKVPNMVIQHVMDDNLADIKFFFALFSLMSGRLSVLSKRRNPK